MSRVFLLHLESEGDHEWVELFYEWDRCMYMSLEVLGSSFFVGNINSRQLDKEGIDCLISSLEKERGNPNPLKKLLKDDKQIEFLKPGYYENCSFEVLQNAIKLVYFHQLPSDDFLAHWSLGDQVFNAQVKKIK